MANGAEVLQGILKRNPTISEGLDTTSTGIRPSGGASVLENILKRRSGIDTSSSQQESEPIAPIEFTNDLYGTGLRGFQRNYDNLIKPGQDKLTPEQLKLLDPYGFMGINRTQTPINTIRPEQQEEIPVKDKVFNTLRRMKEQFKMNLPMIASTALTGAAVTLDSIGEKITGGSEQGRIGLLEKSREDAIQELQAIDEGRIDDTGFSRFFETQKKFVNSDITYDNALDKYKEMLQQNTGVSDLEKQLREKDAEVTIEEQAIAKASDIRQNVQRKQQEFIEREGQSSGFSWYAEQVAGASPSLLSSFGIGVISGLITKNPRIALSVGFSSTFVQETGSAYQDAKEYGVSDETAETVGTLTGLGSGLLETLPIFKFLERSPTGDLAKKAILKNLTKNMIAQGVTEASTESMQQMLNNAVAQTYDENRSLFEGVKETFLISLPLGAAPGGIQTFTNTQIINQSAIDELNTQIQDAVETPASERTDIQNDIVDALTTKELTPTQAKNLVISKDIAQTEEGKKIMKTAIEAENKGANVEIKTDLESEKIDVGIKSVKEILQERGNIGLAQEARKYKTLEEFISAQGQPLYHGTNKDFDTFDVTKAGTVKTSDWGQRGIYFDPTKRGADYYRREAVKNSDTRSEELYKAYEDKAKEFGTKPMYERIDLGNSKDPEKLAKYKELEEVKQEWVDYRNRLDKDESLGRVIEVYLDPKAKIYKYTYGGITDPYLADNMAAQGYDVVEIYTPRDEDGSQRLDEVIVMNPDVIRTRKQLSDVWEQSRIDISGTSQTGDNETANLIKEAIFEGEMDAAQDIYDNATETLPPFEDLVSEVKTELQKIQDEVAPGRYLDDGNITQYKGVITRAVRTYNLNKRKGINDIDSITRKVPGLDEALEALRDAGRDVQTMDELAEVNKLIPTRRQRNKITVAQQKAKDALKMIEGTEITRSDLAPEQAPIGTGKAKESRAYSRVRDRLREEVQQDVNYNPLNLEADAKAAAEFIIENPKEAALVAFGLKPPPPGQTETAISIALANRAGEEGKFRLQSQLEASRSLRQTRRGQEIVSERGRFNENSPYTYVKEIIDRRLNSIGVSKFDDVKDTIRSVTGGKGSNKERAVSKIDQEVTKVKQKMRKDQTKIKLAQDIIDSLRC